jgi:hypothetical protein
MIATIACALDITLWMEQSVLVESDLESRVLSAEDVSALTAMVATIEETKL